MGRHDLAMHHAQSAIMIVQASLLMVCLPERKENKNKNKQKDLKEEGIKQEFKDRISILAVSYHNLGVEQEFLKMYQEAIDSYKQASAFALKYLGSEDAIYSNIN